jgi:hypothetical protein
MVIAKIFCLFIAQLDSSIKMEWNEG